MLYFSKIKLTFIYLTIVILSFFSILNFINEENNFFFKKNINLGLDLQGGSYLLLEINTDPIQNQKLQNKLISLREILKKKNIKYKGLTIKDKKIFFSSNEKNIIH